METTDTTEKNTENREAGQKKSRRGILVIALLIIGVAIYFLVPSENNNGDMEASDTASSGSTITPSEVKIISFEGKKRVIGKWVITGVISNTSGSPIESIEFETIFSDNAEFVSYNEFIEAGETNHHFTIKVTGHKGENLNDLKIREVRKAK